MRPCVAGVSLLCVLFLSASAGAQEKLPQVEGLRAFDFGTPESPVLPGFTSVTHLTTYDEAKRFGWLDVKGLESRDRVTPGALERDWVRGGETFAIKVPNGKYHVWILAADSGDREYYPRWSHRLIKAGGKTVLEERKTDADFLKSFYANLEVEDLPGQDIYMLYVEGRWRAIEFDTEVAGGRLDVEFAGDPEATLVNAMVVYPLSMKKEGEGWLANLNDRRRREFAASHVEAPVPEKAVEVFPNEAEKKRGYVLFQRPYTESVWPTSSPRGGGEEIERLDVALARGEYEPITFCVYPFQDLGKVKVIADVGIMVKHEIDFFEVGYVQYKGKRTELGGTSYQVRPALIRKKNVVRIDKGVTRQFWLTLEIPEDIPGGTYQGSVTVTPEHGESTTLPLTVRVHDFVLSEAKDFVFWMTGTRPRDFWTSIGALDGKKVSDASVRNLRAHGLSDIAPVHEAMRQAPGVGRFAWGAWNYKFAKDSAGAGFRSCGSWMSYFGDPFDDLDAQAADDCAVYPGPEGDINTPAFEVLREQIDDFRYLWTLDRLTEAAKGMSAVKWRDLSLEGDAFLKDVLKQVDEAGRKGPLLGDSVRFEDRRLKAAELIGKFVAAGIKVPR